MNNRKEDCVIFELYVSQTGNDATSDGSNLNPFKTITQAQAFSNDLKTPDKICQTKIIVLPGQYNLTSPIEITEKDNNTAFIAQGKVEISGAIKLNKPAWQASLQNTKVMVTKIEKGLEVDGLYINGEHKILARYPNFTKGIVPLGTASTEKDIKRRTKAYKSVEGGYIRAIHSKGWGGNSYIVTGKDKNAPLGLKLRWIGDNNRGSDYHSKHLVIENIFEELDAPDEWYYDKTTGELFFFPAPGFDLNSADIELSISTELFHIHNAQNITLQGLIFSKTGRTMFTIDKPGKQYVPLLRGDWCVVRSGAILIEESENVSILNSEFSDLYGNAIFISGKNKNHLIDGNEFNRIGASCIQIAGLPQAVYEPSFWPSEIYNDSEGFTVHKTQINEPQHTGPKTDEYPQNITVSNNHMQDMGVYEKQSTGVNISAAKNISIIHNTIHNSPRSCININDGTFGGHIITFNDIFDSQRETEDHGPFNSWGRDRFWSLDGFDTNGQNGAAKRPYALLDAIETTKIHNNRFHHPQNAPHSWGIDLDDGSSNYELYNNLCLGIGVKLREGFCRKVTNNIIIDGQFQIHCTYKQADDVIGQNIVINTEPWGLSGQTGGEELRLTDGNYAIDQNCYYSFGGKVKLPRWWADAGFDQYALFKTDPQFKNPAQNDYAVTNEEVLNKLGFENFNFSFGKPGCTSASPAYIPRKSSFKEEVKEIVWKGAVLSDISYAIMSATATGGTNGVYFKEVPEKSEAYKLGFRANTVIKDLNGKPVNDIESFLKVY